MPANKGDWAFLSIKIDQGQYNKALQGDVGGKINCKYYPFSGQAWDNGLNVGQSCHCADVSIRMIKYITGTDKFVNINEVTPFVNSLSTAPDLVHKRIREIRANDC
jgi:hypothetical protein